MRPMAETIDPLKRAMNRRIFLARASGAAALAAALPALSQSTPSDHVVKTPEEWRKILTPEQFYILREEGTERPYSSALNNEKRKGTYVCAACALPLFTSETKFESGTGWPSFYAPIPGALGTKVDYKIIA